MLDTGVPKSLAQRCQEGARGGPTPTHPKPLGESAGPSAAAEGSFARGPGVAGGAEEKRGRPSQDLGCLCGYLFIFNVKIPLKILFVRKLSLLKQTLWKASTGLKQINSGDKNQQMS